MYFLLKMVIFHCYMLVYQRVFDFQHVFLVQGNTLNLPKRHADWWEHFGSAWWTITFHSSFRSGVQCMVGVRGRFSCVDPYDWANCSNLFPPGKPSSQMVVSLVSKNCPPESLDHSGLGIYPDMTFLTSPRLLAVRVDIYLCQGRSTPIISI